jgi:hypothetical protein
VGVRTEVEDVVGLRGAGDDVHGAAVEEVALVQNDVAPHVGQTNREKGGHDAGQCVDLGPLRDEAATEVGADEAGRPRQEDSSIAQPIHGRLPSAHKALNSMASLYVSIDRQNPAWRKA